MSSRDFPCTSITPWRKDYPCIPGSRSPTPVSEATGASSPWARPIMPRGKVLAVQRRGRRRLGRPAESARSLRTRSFDGWAFKRRESALEIAPCFGFFADRPRCPDRITNRPTIAVALTCSGAPCVGAALEHPARPQAQGVASAMAKRRARPPPEACAGSGRPFW